MEREENEPIRKKDGGHEEQRGATVSLSVVLHQLWSPRVLQDARVGTSSRTYELIATFCLFFPKNNQKT